MAYSVWCRWFVSLSSVHVCHRILQEQHLRTCLVTTSSQMENYATVFFLIFSLFHVSMFSLFLSVFCETKTRWYTLSHTHTLSQRRTVFHLPAESLSPKATACGWMMLDLMSLTDIQNHPTLSISRRTPSNSLSDAPLADGWCDRGDASFDALWWLQHSQPASHQSVSQSYGITQWIWIYFNVGS